MPAEDHERFIRAGVAKDQITAVEALPEAEEILRRIGDEHVQHVAETARVGWVRGETNYVMTETIGLTLGYERAAVFYYDTFGKGWDSPLFRNLARGALRIAGSDPGGLLKILPRGVSMVFRGFGEYEVVERGEDSITIRMVDVPERSFRYDGLWLRLAGESQRSIITFAGRDTGKVDVELTPNRDEATFYFTW